MQYATLQSYGQHILNKLGNLRNEENSDQKCLHFLFLHHGILYCQQSAAICSYRVSGVGNCLCSLTTPCICNYYKT